MFHGFFTPILRRKWQVVRNIFLFSMSRICSVLARSLPLNLYLRCEVSLIVGQPEATWQEYIWYLTAKIMPLWCLFYLIVVPFKHREWLLLPYSCGPDIRKIFRVLMKNPPKSERALRFCWLVSACQGSFATVHCFVFPMRFNKALSGLLWLCLLSTELPRLLFCSVTRIS